MNGNRVLIIDDDPDDALLVQECLTRAPIGAGLSIDHVESGAEAFSRLTRGTYDVLLIDYSLGREDGLSLFQEIRSKGIPTPAIFLTGRGSEGVAAAVMRAGATDYLVKANLRPESLGAAIRHATEMYHSRLAREDAETRLRESEAHLRAIIDNALDAVIEMDAEGSISFWNLRAEAIFGWSRDEAVGRALGELIIPERHREDHARGLRHFLASGEGPLLNRRIEMSALRRDGTEFPVELSVTALRRGDSYGFTAFIEDITDRKGVEEEARRVNVKLSASMKELEHRAQEMGRLGELGDLLQACQTAEEACKVAAHMAQLLFPAVDGALLVITSSRTAVHLEASWGMARSEEIGFPPEACLALRRGKSHFVEEASPALRCPHLADPLPIWYACLPLTAFGDTLGVLHLRGPTSTESGSRLRTECLNDAEKNLAAAVTERLALTLARLRLQETIRDQSIRDPLTGLFNRRHMQECLDRELRRAERSDKSLALMMLDLDHFKRFNDAHGHDAGDALMREFGNFLQSHVRGEDIVCRYGGEEFMIILPEASLEVAIRRAGQLREGVEHLTVHYRRLRLGPVSMSLGVAAYPAHGATPEALVHAADSALYSAKAAGRNRVVVAEACENDTAREGNR